VWRIVRDLVADGVTIFLTTHYLEEADQLADRVAVLDRGRLIAEGSPSELKRLIPGGFIRVEFADARTLEAAARSFPEAMRDDDALILQIPSDGRADSLHDVLDLLRGASIHAERVSVHSPDLDEVFLALTGDVDESEGGQR
jgi:ABC-2 type transport system ATP-binding protein